MVLIIFSAAGAVFGLVAGFIGGAVTRKISFGLAGIYELLFTALIAFAIATIFGSMSIPLVYKFGAERGRVLMLVSFLIPAGICFGVFRLLILLGVELTDRHMFILLCGSPVIAFLWSYGMYRISCGIFARQEL